MIWGIGRVLGRCGRDGHDEGLADGDALVVDGVVDGGIGRVMGVSGVAEEVSDVADVG